MPILSNLRAAAVAVALFGFSLASYAGPTSFDAIYVFGDSYCDVGNIFIATGGAKPAAPYYMGRFSNGPIWLDHLAGTYGLTLKPYLGGGTDYAFGGALVLAAVPETSTFSIPSVPQQVELYLSQHNGKADPNALYVAATTFWMRRAGLPRNSATKSLSAWHRASNSWSEPGRGIS